MKTSKSKLGHTHVFHSERHKAMEQVTIIGSGNMARSIAVRMLKARHSVQILGRNGKKPASLSSFSEPGPRVEGKAPSSKGA